MADDDPPGVADDPLIFDGAFLVFGSFLGGSQPLLSLALGAAGRRDFLLALEVSRVMLLGGGEARKSKRGPFFASSLFRPSFASIAE